MVSEFNNLFLDSVAVLPLSEFLQTTQIRHANSFFYLVCIAYTYCFSITHYCRKNSLVIM